MTRHPFLQPSTHPRTLSSCAAITLLLACLSLHSPTPLQAQEPDPTDSKPSQEQEMLEELNLQTLKKAETTMLEEREAIAKKQERLQALLEQLENQIQTVETKEADFLDQLTRYEEELAARKQEMEVPEELINYYGSRDPQIAAQDFVLLYEDTPFVAIALIKNLKKKKAAALIDAVAKLENKSGKRIAAEIAAAIGTSQ